MTVKPKAGALQPTYFNVFIQRDETLTRPEDHFIRQGITISKINTLKESGYRTLVVVEDRPISTLLGDAENPAHTDWLERATKLKERYEWAVSTVRFVRNAPQRILGQLLALPEGRDEELLKNVFYLETEADDGHEATRSKGRRQKPGEPGKPPEPPQRRVPQIRVEKLDSGFRIRRNPASVEPLERVAVKVAYEVRRGNPFKKYDRFDFAIGEGPVSVVAVAAEVEANGNELKIKPKETEFLVEVTGFDPHRDLKIQAEPEIAHAEAIQLHGSEEDSPVGDPTDAAVSQ